MISARFDMYDIFGRPSSLWYVLQWVVASLQLTKIFPKGYEKYCFCILAPSIQNAFDWKLISKLYIFYKLFWSTKGVQAVQLLNFWDEKKPVYHETAFLSHANARVNRRKNPVSQNFLDPIKNCISGRSKSSEGPNLEALL